MRKYYIAAILFFMFSVNLWAQNFKSFDCSDPIIEKPDKKLSINENLDYSLEWLGIPVGKINLHIEGEIMISGREYYLIAAKALPNSFFKKFYDFEYNVSTLVDTQTFLTRRFEKTRRIGKDSVREIIDFDRASNIVHYKVENAAPKLQLSFDRVKMEQDIPQTYELVPNAQDLFSALYYFRVTEVKPDSQVKLDVYYALRNWKVDAYIGKARMVALRKKGTRPVFNVRLSSQLNRFVFGKEDMDVTFTADSRRIPVYFKFGSGIGTFRGVLEEFPKK
ncbi:MAG: DUF3108 domain-containing protein [Candidatus Omnitrophica bacterium]|nr:DUF3108 domain-containing protein [Candidatus Omnitrophota bacterium]